MAKLLIVLLLVAAASGGSISKVKENLKFDVTSSRSIEEAPTIEVTFDNGVKDALVLKHYRMNEHSSMACHYLGHLRNSPSSSVAVTGCLNKPGDRMEVTLISEHNINKMFSVDFNGYADIIKNPFDDIAVLVDREFDDQDGDEILNDAEEAEVQGDTGTLPAALKITIKFAYDQGLKEELGDEDFNNWIAEVFTHTQAHFLQADSLGSSVVFDVQGDAHYQDGVVWRSEDKIYDARDVTNSLGLDTVDVMAWWTSSYNFHKATYNNEDNTAAGMGFVGVLCGYSKVSINEKQSYAAGSGFVLAHELGHNFGMSHDFSSKHGGDDGPCNGQGIMSYGSYSYDQWSSCSQSDFKEHYFGLNWETCLEDISDCSDCVPTTTTTTTTPTPCENIANDWNCENWHGKGYCTETYVSWMKTNCYLTCGYCDGSEGGNGEGPECFDNNIDYYGNDLEQPAVAETSATVEECQQLCQESKFCNAFTYNTVYSQCWLKSSDAGRTSYNGAISGPKFC